MRPERRFPFETLPRVPRAEVGPLRRAARALPGEAPERTASVLGDLLGAACAVTPGPIERTTTTELSRTLVDPIAAVVLEPTGSLKARIALELDPRLALVVVDRALGGAGGDGVSIPTTGLSEIERGVLAYVVARALSASGTPRFAVAGIVTSRIALAAALDAGSATVWPATISIGGDRGIARAILPDRALDAIPAAPTSRLPPTLLTLPVEVSVEASWGELSATELASVRPGDVVLLDRTTVRRADDGLEGTVRAHELGGHGPVWICDLRGGTLTIASIEAGREPSTKTEHGASARRAEGATMDDTDTERQVLERAGDFPVEVAVEIARFSLPLVELASLRPGEVLATGRALGARVVVRSGGRDVAEGELVDVDGELGVRIVSAG